MTALQQALGNLNMDEVTRILNSNSAPSQTELNSALRTAISSAGPDDAVVPLLSHGAQITDGAVSTASARGDVIVFQAFLAYGWDINSLDFGQPAMRLVTRNQHVVQWFLDHGADPNLRGKSNLSVLAAACFQPSSISTLKLLLSHGADLDPAALYNAMSPRGGAGIEHMKVLIEHGIDLNSPGVKVRHFATPLYYAVELRSMEKVKLLLDAGADRTIKTYGKTPADRAKEKGYNEIFDLLSK